MFVPVFSRETELLRRGVCVCIKKETYYKKLVHAIMEADKSQDLQTKSPKRGDGVVLLQMPSGSKPNES